MQYFTRQTTSHVGHVAHARGDVTKFQMVSENDERIHSQSTILATNLMLQAQREGSYKKERPGQAAHTVCPKLAFNILALLARVDMRPGSSSFSEPELPHASWDR